MALMEEGSNGVGTTMLVQPSGFAGGGYGNGNGFFGNDFAWILLLLLIGGNGWGFGGFGGMGGMMWPMMMGGMGAGMGLDYLYPWLNNSEHINDGFRDQQIQTTIGNLQNSVTAGFGDMQNSLCNGFGQMQLGLAGINQNLCQTGNDIVSAVNGAQNSLAQQMYQNQLSDLERSFAVQTANTQGMTALQAQLASCCCDQKQGISDLKYVVATENCADRTAAMQNTRDIIDAQNRGTQAILDKLCQLELDNAKSQLDAKDDTINQLRAQLQFANMQASQVDQTAQLRTSQATVANQLVSELRSCPIPSQPVYGNQPIFTCGGNTGCGCGCAA